MTTIPSLKKVMSKGKEAKSEHGKNNKRAVSKLADDFREQIFDKLKDTEWAQFVAIAWATGCRPEEMTKGIFYTIDDKTNSLDFKIEGAKVSEDLKRGLSLRAVRVPITDSPHIQYLIEKVLAGRAKSGKTTISLKSTLKNKVSFSNRIRETSKQIWPKRKNHASPYSFRHQLVSEMKSAGMDAITIATTLGQQSTASQESYGRKRGSGGVAPVSLAQSIGVEKVRAVESPLTRFKKPRAIAKVKARGMSM